MRNFLAIFETVDLTQDYVLAIILDTEGSTYRKSGALMLIDQSLNYWGLLSGGCLEGDIQQHCQKVLDNKSDSVIRYDMRGEEDLLWGMGLGCDGAINLLLKYLPQSQKHHGVFEVLNAVNKGQNHLLIVDRTKPFQLDWVPLAKRQTRVTWRDTEINLPEQLTTRPVPCHLQSKLVVPIPSPLHILICGASPDVSPVVSIAVALGWKITVIDHRQELANPTRFPEAQIVRHVKRSQWQTYEIEHFDAAIIMSHQFERDKDYLSRLLTGPTNYIGLLGPSKRRDLLLKECDSSFTQVEGRVFGPVGLDIGADTPETIALAIISEIQAIRANKRVGFCYQDETR